MTKIEKAVIPVAGLGTRFLPATKAQPKEMLPLVDKPVIQYVVEEAIASGTGSIVLITGRGKQAIENHFDVAHELEEVLRKRGRTEDLEQVRGIARMADFLYVRQGEPLGLGHAVLCARAAVGQHPFALLLGDDVFDGETPALRSLVEVHERTGRSVVGVQLVPEDQVSRYGIVNPPAGSEPFWAVDQILEKPSRDVAPSRWAVVGRYVLDPEIFEELARLQPGVGGEYQLTDALARLAEKGRLLAAPIPARRFDTGNKLDYLMANIEFALQRPELGPELRRFLETLLNA
ncbi:MAG: UTP--glucose-1-phosphate uridylyltransferase GalU [Acidobacteria bacterium]|nr:UTP--glucose-1-phosphate uridylyltransferase GalU [Acidobacteriota bacterium]